MRHRYDTRGIVLSRAPSGEANAHITLLTPTLGLVRARAQGVRKSGAKLSHSLTTFSESSLILVRGKEEWRIAGAVLEENWFCAMPEGSARDTAIRVAGLLLRLVAGEARDEELFSVTRGFFSALSEHAEADHEAIEMLAVLRMLAALGLDAGEIPGDVSDFSPTALSAMREDRVRHIARINHGINASGL
ncbi:MAG: recombination protein O N-terminal domain-containing protein [Minisyncoccia bacterium]